jgi:threonine dehydrogenase-like Zn-dependent dehydrogenase
MKAAIVSEARELEVLEVTDPVPGPYECLVKIDACAICTGTDSNIISGNFPWLEDPPFILGHESTGTIVEVGRDVRNFETGQRVTRPAGILAGQRRDGIGSNWGGFAELGLVVDTLAAREAGRSYTGMAESSRRPLPEGVDPVSGALSVNQREILSVVGRLRVGPESRVAVLGSGYNGMLFSLFLKEAGAGRVILIGSGGRERLARESFGADLFLDYREDGGPEKVRALLESDPDIVIDAVGKLRSMELARDIVGPRTSFGRYGLHEFDRIGQVQKEIEGNRAVLDLAADEVSATDRWYGLWKQGLFDREGMCDGTVPLGDIQSAFERLARREAMKMVVTM